MSISYAKRLLKTRFQSNEIQFNEKIIFIFEVFNGALNIKFLAIF